MKKVFGLAAMMTALLVVGAACSSGVAQEDYDAAVAERDSALGELAAIGTLPMPDGYEQASPVVPQMGEHWANMAEFMAQAQSNRPMGPIYLVHKGEVIGVEYMVSSEMGQEVTIEEGGETETFLALPSLPVGAIVDHTDAAFVPEGHPEIYPVPHWDIHFYFITPEEKAAIVPEG